MHSLITRTLVVGLVFACTIAHAQLSEFSTGPLIKDFGKNATVSGVKIDPDSKFSIAFDVGAPAEVGTINRHFDSLARFLNMHVAAGVKPENIRLVLVVHGKASMDMLNHEAYQKAHNKANPNVALLHELMAHNVDVILCGQTARAYEINRSQLVKGATIALSAMTAHAQLQQQGYTVNPF